MAKTVMSELVVKMTAETASLKAEMERVRKGVDTTVREMTSGFGKSQKSIDAMTTSFKKVGVAVAAITVAFRAVSGAASSMVG